MTLNANRDELNYIEPCKRTILNIKICLYTRATTDHCELVSYIYDRHTEGRGQAVPS